MTELAHREPAAPVTYQQRPSTIAQWAMDAQQANLVAQSLAGTMFVPQALRGKPDEITAAILTGAEMGLQPMAALRALDVIQGTPAFRANTLRGLVQAHGHEIWVESTTDTRAVVKGKRFNSDRVEESVWTIERARQLGVTSKDNWKKQPGTMLVARATTDIARRIAADVILALPYSSEEVEDGFDSAPSDAPPQPVQRRRKAAKAIQPAPDVPPLDEAPVTPDSDAAEPDDGDDTDGDDWTGHGWGEEPLPIEEPQS